MQEIQTIYSKTEVELCLIEHIQFIPSDKMLLVSLLRLREHPMLNILMKPLSFSFFPLDSTQNISFSTFDAFNLSTAAFNILFCSKPHFPLIYHINFQ